MTAFQDSQPYKAAVEMSDLLTEKIEVLTIHPYPITPEMMRHGKGVGGLDYSGSDEEL